MNIKIELIVVYDAHHKHSYSLNGMAYSWKYKWTKLFMNNLSLDLEKIHICSFV